MRMRFAVTLTLAAAMTVGALYLNPTAQAAGPMASKVVDSQGNLQVPENYRHEYEFLGSWTVAADAGVPGSKDIHQVYASPAAIAAFRKAGRFPDGTVLVKEVYDTATASMTTGTVSHVQTLKGWFVMVKDGHDTHAGNPLWGNGWGWSWFDADKPTKTTSTDFKKDCLGCHVPAKDTDWIYTQGYPVLK